MLEPNFSREMNNRERAALEVLALRTRVDADATLMALGAVLLQIKGPTDDDPQPIAYTSKSLTEQRLCQNEKQVVALVWAAEHLSVYPSEPLPDRTRESNGGFLGFSRSRLLSNNVEAQATKPIIKIGGGSGTERFRCGMVLAVLTSAAIDRLEGVSSADQ